MNAWWCLYTRLVLADPLRRDDNLVYRQIDNVLSLVLLLLLSIVNLSVIDLTFLLFFSVIFFFVQEYLGKKEDRIDV